uniref:Ig-like domain-containing protein n=1 Tax=Coturnix japonica TaxID=93934 RepID=A0A8C2YG45_COTJA
MSHEYLGLADIYPGVLREQGEVVAKLLSVILGKLWLSGKVWVCAQPRIVEVGGGLRESGESVPLSCQGSGFNFKSHHVFWYREARSGQIEWLSYATCFFFYTSFSPKMENRATASRDNEKAVASLSLRAVHPHDSARYFCAIHTGAGNPPEL